MDSLLNEYIWEFEVDRKDHCKLILKQIYQVNSQTFTDIECIEQWNFVIPESNICCNNPEKIINIRKGITDCNAMISDGKVKIL